MRIVPKPQVEYFVWPCPPQATAKEIADILNANVAAGWRLIAVDNGNYVLGREVERDHGPTPCARHHDRPSVTWISDSVGFRTACQECKDEHDKKSNVLNSEYVG